MASIGTIRLVDQLKKGLERQLPRNLCVKFELMGAGLVEQVRLPNQSYLLIPEPAPKQRAAQSFLCQAQPSIAVLAEGE